MGAIRSRIDTGRVHAAIAAPPEMWTALGLVKGDVVVDREEGLFVNVTMMPDGFVCCCRVAAIYSGDGFGAYFPLRDGEQVIVGFPQAETFGSPCILGRVPSRDEKPPDEFQNDVVLVKMKDGESIRLLTQGSGQVRLGTGQNEASAARYEDLKSAIDAYLTANAAHTHGTVTDPTLATAKTAFDAQVVAAKSASVKVD